MILHFDISVSNFSSRFLYLGAAMTAGVSLNAFVITSALADPPDPGSKQMNRMKPFVDFITHMYAGKQFCCNLGDGRMGDFHRELEERIIDDPDGGSHYRVFVTRDIFGVDSHNPADPADTINKNYEDAIPLEGRWLDVPRESVVSDQAVLDKCPTDSETCAPPGANVLWFSRYGGIFCYWPIHRWTQEMPFRPQEFRHVSVKAHDRFAAAPAM